MKKILAIISICSGIYSLQAQSLGDVDLSRFVYGDNNTKTSYFNDPNSAYPSGFYNQHTGTNMPYETWWHMINNRHINASNNYQFQIAADFWGDNTYFRKLVNNSPTPWRRILNDGQDVYAASLNQHLRTTDNVTFASATINGTQSIMTSSLGDLYGTDQAFIGSNLVLKGVESSRTVGRGSSLTFAFPANTDGSNIWEQARILASPDNTYNGNAQGRLYLQVRDAYNPPGVGGSWNWRTGLMISANGSVGIGTTTINNVQGWNRVIDEYAPGHAKLLVRTDNVVTGIFSHDTWNGAIGRIGTESPHDLRLMAGYGHDVMSLTISGNVGIGTTNPDEKLTVNGVIHAKEVKVDLSGPLADYVFKPNYKLMSLPQVEQFVKANNHLPQMPSAEEVSKNGLSMGEMQNKLLQKVEEQTLYIIELNKQVQTLKKQLEKLENK